MRPLCGSLAAVLLQSPESFDPDQVMAGQASRDSRTPGGGERGYHQTDDRNHDDDPGRNHHARAHAVPAGVLKSSIENKIQNGNKIQENEF
jgi:hypothetical protein